MTQTQWGVPQCGWAPSALEFLHNQGPQLIIVPEEEQVDALVSDLRTLAPERRILPYQDDEQSPYSPLTPDPQRGWSRLGILARLTIGEPIDLVVASAAAVGRSVPDLESVAEWSLVLTVGEALAREELLQRLEAAGYHRVPLVEDPGTVALRGSIVDLWPPGEAQPVRTDFFGDEIESIRAFDPSTQRQGRTLDLLVVPPARSFSVGPAVAQANRQTLLDLSDQIELPSASFLKTWQRLEAGIRYPGVEALEPLLRPGNTTLLELLPRATSVLQCHPRQIDHQLVETDAQLMEGFAQRGDEELAAPPTDHRWDRDQVQAALSRHKRVVLDAGQGPDEARPRFSDLEELRRDLAVASRRALRDEVDLLSPLTEQINQWRQHHYSVLVCCSSTSRQERLCALLERRNLTVRRLNKEPLFGEGHSLNHRRDPKVHLYIGLGDLQSGWVDHKRLLVMLPERIISGRRQSGRSQRPTQFNTTLSELRPGKPVVHLDFGIGRYEGIERRQIDGVEHDFIRVDFRDDDKVFVPMARIGVLRPYDAGGDPKLDKIGGTAWHNRCARVRRGILEIAHRLVETQARREAVQVAPLRAQPELAASFDQLFPYRPTVDQETAFDAIAKDMASAQPMDRLVCGDVGFGKTEVAMRAAFVAVANARQVAVLVPTTVLCQQHLRSFRERFEAVGARVAGLSRLSSPQEVKETLAGLADGQIDVVVGTHKLLGRQIRFRALGLLVVDEEQRFGVRHKERIKEVCHGVHVLTMTATPIPRTLQLSMLGVRALSTIKTPPASRRAVRTSVCRYDDGMVRDAVTREFERGGQVFFLHNRVEDLDAVAGHLGRLIPEAHIGIAHGQMTGDQADKAMIRFISGDTNLLVCTTIIESGLDIPNANTILVHRADRFGLAQLHQIRGRVGRRRERGYCYLLLRQDEDHLSEDARRRLEAMRRFAELGAGLRIAREDLDLRGAGNLIGSDQSGHIEAVGIDLYSELLRDAIARIKGGQINTLANVDVRVGRPALVPRQFMPDAAERISLYDRLSRADNDTTIAQLEEELGDRYGELPSEVEALFICAQVRWRAGCAGAHEITAVLNGEGEHQRAVLAASFESGQSNINPADLVSWVGERSAQARLTASGRLVWEPTRRVLENSGLDPAKLALRFADELQRLAQPEHES